MNQFSFTIEKVYSGGVHRNLPGAFEPLKTVKGFLEMTVKDKKIILVKGRAKKYPFQNNELVLVKII